MVKLLYFDCETTGLDPKSCAIVQLAGFVVIDGREVDRFDIKCRPWVGSQIEEKALEIQGRDNEEIMGYPDPKEAFTEFVELLNKYGEGGRLFFVGYNSKFDEEFLRAFLSRYSYQYGKSFWSPSLDVMALAAFHLMTKRHDLENFKLGTVAEYFGVKTEGALHDAFTDIDLTRKIMVKISSEIWG